MYLSKVKIIAGIVLALTLSAAGGLVYKIQAGDPAEEAPHVEQKKVEDARAAAIKALEQFAKTDQSNDREAAIKALVDFRREFKAAEEARQRHPARAARFLTDRFKFRVPVEIGAAEFKEGCRIDILEVWGTRPRVEGFGQYLVRGKYTMPSHARGTLYFYLTAKEGQGWAPTLDLQRADVCKGQGEFTLIHGMAEPGFFHLQLLDDRNNIVANVYFGTGDNVLRKKTW